MFSNASRTFTRFINSCINTKLLSSPQQILQQYWQHKEFRGNQAAIIDAVLNKKDVLALLPTGGGKSICFQVPAMLMDGVCLVISPLIALMKDQVEHLIHKGISAVSLHGGLLKEEVEDVLEAVVEGQYKFLYVSPERLISSLFKAYLAQMTVCLIAVDEAHCVSQWGYDFRKPYLLIADIRYELKKVPMIALTASATPVVQEDIIDKLKLWNVAIFRQSFQRDNLSYSAFMVESKINKAIDILHKVAGSSIIYCNSRNNTKEVAHLLKLQNISADYYHAGLSQEERTLRQENWIENMTRVMVCTNAFGMGIDKPDVRTVIHLAVPDCLESYYQEAGRAGRDGNKSYAVLIYDTYDVKRMSILADWRFPPFDEIKNVYQSLANFMHIPVGSGKGIFYDFDIQLFSSTFHIKTGLAISVLNILEQEGHLCFEENVFLPTRVMFTATKSELEDFENARPLLDPLVKCLLRSYSGIYDHLVDISEKQIANKLRISIEDLHDKLAYLRSFGIIRYLPQKETPQIHFILNRAPAAYLSINHETYLERKNAYQKRVDNMLGYLNLDKQCREQFISNYFGDKEAKPCGICDNCLTLKKKATTSNDVIAVQQQLLGYLQTGNPTVKGLLEYITLISEDKIWDVLQLLQDQNKIVIDDNGMITKK